MCGVSLDRDKVGNNITTPPSLKKRKEKKKTKGENGHQMNIKRACVSG